PHPVEAQEAGEQRRVLVGGAPLDRLEPPVAAQDVAFVHSEHRVGIAYVDDQQHPKTLWGRDVSHVGAYGQQAGTSGRTRSSIDRAAASPRRPPVGPSPTGPPANRTRSRAASSASRARAGASRRSTRGSRRRARTSRGGSAAARRRRGGSFPSSPGGYGPRSTARGCVRSSRPREARAW